MCYVIRSMYCLPWIWWVVLFNALKMIYIIPFWSTRCLFGRSSNMIPLSMLSVSRRGCAESSWGGGELLHLVSRSPLIVQYFWSKIKAWENLPVDFAYSILNSNEFKNWLPNRRSVDTNYMSLRNHGNSEQISVPIQSKCNTVCSIFGINSSIIV